MTREEYIKLIKIFRSQKSSLTSADAYAQMDRMMHSTSGVFTTHLFDSSCAGAKPLGDSTKGSNLAELEDESTTSPSTQ
jgi:hypothetical protein